MNNTNLFSGKAECYNKARPGYSIEFIKYLYGRAGFNKESVIADIGSGTGKFSKYLLQRGSKVFCVEPNEDMRKTADRELSIYSNFISVKGEADNTALENSSVDFITVAQAFHWFDTEKFRLECRRILKPGGKAILVWNSRDINHMVNMASNEINKKYCPKFKGFSGGIVKDDERINDFFCGKYERIEFSNNIYYNRDNFIRRSLSSSYSLNPDDENYSEYIKKMEYIFDQYSCDGIIEIGNNTVGYIGEV
ncbi:MAG: class I SAM-dependent methyltransferase [Clostridia bacterium]|nr:class I SAM-dependent methyltransferase [Clostridia bacterium]